jgi:hypothetical protein
MVVYTPWPESASELYRLNSRRLSATLVSNFADRGYRNTLAKTIYNSNFAILIVNEIYRRNRSIREPGG